MSAPERLLAAMPWLVGALLAVGIGAAMVAGVLSLVAGTLA